MSDKYPSTSPFMYVRGNPVILIDPNGMWDTDFGIKSNGDIVQIGQKNNEPDRLYAINDDGTKKSENHIVIPKGSVSNIIQGSYKEVDSYNSKTKTYTYKNKPAQAMIVKGDKLAQNLFEFIAINTKVEIAKTAVGNVEGDNGLNVISTSKEISGEGGCKTVINYCDAMGIPIRGNDHSHVDNDPNPSGEKLLLTGKGESGDIQFAISVQKKYPNSIFRIFTPQNRQYIKY